MSQARGHDWTVRRLPAFSIGMLPESETLELDEHLASCPECRERLVSIRPVAGADVGHLPASLVATWPRATRLLSGIERDLVAHHLEGCESCRASLEFSGHEPVLLAEERMPPRPVARASRRRTAWMWALGLSGATAGVAAWLLANPPAQLPGASNGSASATMGAANSRSAQAVAFELAVDSLASGALLLPEPAFRGSPVRELDLGVVTSVSGVVMVVPPALRPPSAEAGARTMTLTLLRDGREVASRQVRFYALGDAIRLRPSDRLEAGVYDLRFSLSPALPDERPLVWFYRLHVR